MKGMWAQLRKRWLRIALVNFLIAAYIGMLMRYAFVEELQDFAYRNYLHAHSHIAMLGWLYPALIVNIFGSLKPASASKRIHRLLILIQICVVGMLMTYPFGGYWSGSIFFTSLHVLIAYILSWIALRSIRRKSRPLPFSMHMIRASLWFFLLSTLSLWAMPFLMAGKLAGSALYYANIQFFLHFQINGWFIFAVLGLFFRLLEKRDIPIPRIHFKYFYLTLVVSCILTYAIAVAWSNPAWYIYAINSLGVVIQLAALFYFFRILRVSLLRAAPHFSLVSKTIIGLAIGCFAIKVLIQTAVVVPEIATVAYTIRNFVIGFLHLILLGMISLFVIGTAISRQDYRIDNPAAKTGLALFVLGFIATEIILFGQGLLIWLGESFIPDYYAIIFGFTMLLPVGLLLFFFGQFSGKKE